MTRILFLHPNVHDIDSFLEFTGMRGFVDADLLVWDEDSPQLLFASEMIYYKSDLFKRFVKLFDTALLRIGYLAEALEADFNIFDYAFGFCPDVCGRFTRLPSPSDMFHRFVTRRDNELIGREQALKLLESKKGFCNFLYSNPKAHPRRDELFREISLYKRVDSLGKHLNNMEGRPGTGFAGRQGECVGIKSAYKFSIACENARFRGYTTEKILTSLQAHTVPIYWGDPDINLEINPDCFVNASDYDSPDKLIARIREIDENPELWADIVSSPWMTPQQEDASIRRTKDYRIRMRLLLEGGMEPAIAQGYHSSLYRNFAFKRDFVFDGRLAKLCKRL